jgi:leucine dehydrogenase
MSKGIQELIAAWDGVGVVSRYDRPTGTWIFVCLHNDSLGPATGGSRMKVYPELGDALEDGMRLAEGMTYKWAGIGVDAGGGKAVLAIPRPLEGDERTGLLHRYGELLEALRGSFRTGEDLGTSTHDMKVVAERTQYIQGFHPTTGEKINPSPFTAEAVYRAIQAALGVVYDSSDPAGRSVLIQGVGNVGERLARRLAAAGAKVLVNDLDDSRAAALAGELGGEAVLDGDLYGSECDVYAPCAVGATLSSETIPQLACKIVCGSANNQLAEEADAERLRERGIVYTPDYVANAGGALSFALIEQGILDEDELLERMSGVGEMVTEILTEAIREEESPVASARRRVERQLRKA